MNQQINLTAPVSSLLGDLQDISAALAAEKAPAAAFATAFDVEQASPFPAEAWNHIKRKTALFAGIICEIDQSDLDRLIVGYTRRGLLITHYQQSIGATVYRRPDGSVVAMTAHGRHFCPRDIRPLRSVTLAIQTVGRANRIQWTDAALPLLTREGGAGEGASAMTTALIAKYFGVPLNIIDAPINTALFTEGLNVPESNQ
jgi:hypothetical protein